MPHDVWTPMITIDPDLRSKSLRARNKVAHVELLLGLARPVPRYTVTVIYRNQQRKKQKNNFGKSLFLIKYRMCSAISMPSNAKDLAINQTMVAYGNRQNATVFARSNNSDLLRSLKHLMETRLYCS